MTLLLQWSISIAGFGTGILAVLWPSGTIPSRGRLGGSERRASLCWESSSRITASDLSSRAARTSSGFSSA
jgi:hypothetical protein